MRGHIDARFYAQSSSFPQPPYSACLCHPDLGTRAIIGPKYRPIPLSVEGSPRSSLKQTLAAPIKSRRTTVKIVNCCLYDRSDKMRFPIMHPLQHFNSHLDSMLN